MNTAERGLAELLGIIARLRAPNGCPWDREQTPSSIKKYILEETYELLEAIDEGNPKKVQEELGDLVFLLLFLASMYQEQGLLKIEDVFEFAARKMIRRHPHIFGDVKVSGTEDVVANWQAEKAKEAKEKGERPSILGNLPKGLPALQRAFRLGERASRVGFDWNSAQAVFDKLREEETELRQAIASGDKELIKHEAGDLLFTMANLARKLGINPEQALQDANARFTKRFKTMEEQISSSGMDMRSMSLSEMDKIWEEIKQDK